MITPSGTADSLTTAMDYVFRTCFRDSFQGELAAQYAKDEGYTKVGIVYCSADTYSAGLRDAFTAACGDKGLEIVAEESVASMTEVDYTNQFNKMVSAATAEMTLESNPPERKVPTGTSLTSCLRMASRTRSRTWATVSASLSR